MLKLRTILLYNYPYYILLIVVILLTIFRLNRPCFSSSYHSHSRNFTGIITNIKIEGDLLQFTLKDKNNEKVIASYYFNNQKEKITYSTYFHLGEVIEVEGQFTHILKNTTITTFNYQEYAQRKRLFYCINIESLKKVSTNKNIIYFWKNIINKYFETFKNGKYLKLILLGDKNEFSKEVLESFRSNGISHLFAISGMHIGVLTSIVLKILLFLQVKENKRYFIVSLFLICYLFLVGLSPSVIRAVFFFLLLSINRIYYLHITSKNIFLLTLAVTLLINPYFIYDVGFQYSFLISFALIISSDLLQNKTYFVSLLLTSLISFCISIPVTIYHFYQINLLGIIYNLVYVPFVTFLLFPLSLIILICPFLSFLYDILIYILEKSSLILNGFDFLKLIFGKVDNRFYFIYIILIFLFLQSKKKFSLLLFLLLLTIHFFIYMIVDYDFITMLDVGQGDSFIIHSKGKTVLIDTGGKINYNENGWRKKRENSIVLNTTIPYLKSKGIRKINYVFLTHGDFDHLGEVINLLDNYQVDQVFINEGKVNNLEKKILKKSLKAGVCRKGDYFEIGKFKLMSLNHDLGDENSSSIVFYITYNHYKMLFMGDANFKSERYLLNEYELPKVNILKLGHHGSKTSSSNEFLKRVNPDIALISAGRDNKFKHPSKETLIRLKNHHIDFYSTQKEGTVELIFTLNKIFPH